MSFSNYTFNYWWFCFVWNAAFLCPACGLGHHARQRCCLPHCWERSDNSGAEKGCEMFII